MGRKAVSAVLGGVLALFVPTHAAGMLQADVATLRIYTGSSAEIRTSGTEGGRSKTRLCVASTSGRYRLTIASRSGSMTGPGQLSYTILFRDGTGAEQSATARDLPVVHFDGASPGAIDCRSGPNAEIEIRIDKANVLSGVAGDYFDQLNLTVSPL